MKKLNPNAQKWVDALRSGKYEQGIGQLRHENNFCCLGVACHIAARDVRKRWRDGMTFDGEMDVLPASVMKWLGAKDANPDIDGRSLAKFNDNGKTFAQIADLIEEHAEELGVSA